jgi:hypothetical protein
MCNNRAGRYKEMGTFLVSQRCETRNVPISYSGVILTVQVPWPSS